MSSAAERMINARLNGHSWDAIHDTNSAMMAEGVSREQLGFAPVTGLMNDMSNAAVRSSTPVLMAAAANDNSPYAWTRGKAPVGSLEGFLGGGGGMGGPRPTPPVLTPSKVGETTIGGPKWKMQSGETISGNMGKATEGDQYNMSLMKQKAANTQDKLTVVKGGGEAKPTESTGFDTLPAEHNSDLPAKKVEEMMSGSGPGGKNQGVELLEDKARDRLDHVMTEKIFDFTRE